MQAEILARVFRGETVESIHRGHLLIVDGTGREIERRGDPETLAFIRSSAKAFQVMPFVASGGADHFGYTEAEIALACASHSGERMHTELAAAMLAKAGLSESALRCGTHTPFSEKRAEEMIAAGEKPTQLHNNCSGKHSAMLAFARFIGADIATYDEFGNPVQKAILEIVEMFTGTPKAEIPIAVDGCAAPNYALSVAAMARAALRLVNPPDHFSEEIKTASSRISRAMMNHPQLVGGSGRLDTILMEAAPGRLVSKIGAEGVWLAAVPPCETWPDGLGIAMKIEDGDDRRARAAVSVEILRRLRLIGPDGLAGLSPLPVTNRRGDVVGRVECY